MLGESLWAVFIFLKNLYDSKLFLWDKLRRHFNLHSLSSVKKNLVFSFIYLFIWTASKTHVFSTKGRKK